MSKVEGILNVDTIHDELFNRTSKRHIPLLVSDASLNNVVEYFISKVKIIIGKICDIWNMLQWGWQQAITNELGKNISVNCMDDGLRKLQTDHDFMEKEKMMRYHGPIVPKVQNKLEKTKRKSRFWTPVWAGDREGARYEVQCLPHKYDVNLSTRSCSCNE
ncbi:uncharacterized protein G2W53_027536 [Senna tora]|uniref:Uncharacterized protein n=1 Tax=Senna tora TaxID=362788 RepID=A0A834WJX8_9FABA|nr:uncharacterized protein G2W53_027536 [Senna tora]